MCVVSAFIVKTVFANVICFHIVDMCSYFDALILLICVHILMFLWTHILHQVVSECECVQYPYMQHDSDVHISIPRTYVPDDIESGFHYNRVFSGIYHNVLCKILAIKG